MGKEGAMSESKGKILFEFLAVLLLLFGGGAMLSQTFGDSKKYTRATPHKYQNPHYTIGAK